MSRKMSQDDVQPLIPESRSEKASGKPTKRKSDGNLQDDGAKKFKADNCKKSSGEEIVKDRADSQGTFLKSYRDMVQRYARLEKKYDAELIKSAKLKEKYEDMARDFEVNQQSVLQLKTVTDKWVKTEESLHKALEELEHTRNWKNQLIEENQRLKILCGM